jgi:hypothetical protein
VRAATGGCSKCGREGSEDVLLFLSDEVDALMSSISHTLAFSSLVATVAFSEGDMLGVESLEVKLSS